MKSVFVLDDSPEFLIYVEALISRLGCKVEMFNSPEKFIEKFKQQRPDLCLIDNDLGNNQKTEGLLLSRVLKKSIKDQVKIVIVSGLNDPKAIVESYSYRVDDYFTKPLDKDLFVEKIKFLLGIISESEKLPIRLLNDSQKLTVSLSGKVIELGEWHLKIESDHYIRESAMIELHCPFIADLITKYNVSFNVADCLAMESTEGKYSIKLEYVVRDSDVVEFSNELRQKLSRLVAIQ